MTPGKLSRIYEFVERFLGQEDFNEFVKIMEQDENDGQPQARSDRQQALDSLPPKLRRGVVADIQRREIEAVDRCGERWPSVAKIGHAL